MTEHRPADQLPEDRRKEVFRSLLEAVILVALVVLVFLQNWRSALIPLLAVPVAIVGTFAVMAAIGFSLNNLTLFGLVLAVAFANTLSIKQAVVDVGCTVELQFPPNAARVAE